MSYTVGIVVGKFMPLHKGHELMIKTGAAMLDEIIVLVSGKETDEMSLDLRTGWMSDFVRTNRLQNVQIIRHVDESPVPMNVDENGTVLDEDFQEYWEEEFSRYNPTHIVSSDLYGGVLADRMDLEWLPVDPKREMFPVSATMIRNETTRFYSYISNSAKGYFQKRIAVLGPESTGKSTLVKDLSEIFDMQLVHEYGRTVSEHKGMDLTEDDFTNIFRGQKALIESSGLEKPAIITDTDAFTTYLFGKIYLNKELSFYQYDLDFDLYILLAPTVPWVQDGDRILEKQEEREKFFTALKNYLDFFNKRYIVVYDEQWSDRLRTSIEAVNNLLHD